MSVNKTILVGHIGHTPKIHAGADGKRVASLSVATSKRWKNEAGEQKEVTTWHKVVVFNQATVSFVEQYVKKGSKVYVEGEIATRQYTPTTETTARTIVEIVVRGGSHQILGLDRTEGGAPPPSENDYTSTTPAVDDDIPY